VKRVVLSLAALAALGALGNALPAGAATKNVEVRDFSFGPQKRTVAKGDRVRFEWTGFADHNVTFRRVPEGATKPRRCATREDGVCRRKFGRRGTYRYVCTIHVLSDGMRGRVVVE
jgi:plastocyanin